MKSEEIDPVLLAVISSSLEGIVREMSDTLLRSGRSSVLNMARDFSCSLLTADNSLLAAAEGIPVHIFGAGLLGEAMSELHPDFSAGDAYLHNDPYRGNSHAADHSILVPIFVGEVHVATAVAKAHQADCGNCEPSTYAPRAKDVYEEGAIIFPCVKVQSDYADNADIVRMCEARIRVPEQWYGDYLAMVGAARIGERRVQALVKKYGVEVFDDFIRSWFDYSERRMKSAISALPAESFDVSTIHDPFPGTDPGGLCLSASVDIRPEEGTVAIDLRDNPDNLPNGLNLTAATATSAAITGLLGSLAESVPVNSGSFRRVEVPLREGSVAGIPRFPASCSVATTNVADRIISMIQRGMAQIVDGIGAAEGGLGQPPAKGVISGVDQRTGRPYVNQLLIGAQGGPGTPYADGWPTYHRPVADALIYHDSVEIDEERYPIVVHERSLVPNSGGHGRHRGGQSTRVSIEPRFAETVLTYAVEARANPPRGVRGGHDAWPASVTLSDGDGGTVDAPLISALSLSPGQRIVSTSTGGAGYGDPLDRSPSRVFEDVLEGRISQEVAFEIYGLVIKGGEPDYDATELRRSKMQVK